MLERWKGKNIHFFHGLYDVILKLGSSWLREDKYNYMEAVVKAMGGTVKDFFLEETFGSCV